MSVVEIEVRGPEESMRHVQALGVGETIRVGRDPVSGCRIPWEKQMSREHGDAHWDGKELRFTCLPSARNPAYFERRPHREFVASIGDEFSIGKTRFLLARVSEVDDRNDPAAPPRMIGSVQETVFSSAQLSRVSFGNTERQMEALARLPSMISASQSDDRLAAKLAGLLLKVIPQAEGTAVVRLDPYELKMEDTSSSVIPEAALASVETRGSALVEFRPSRRLALKSLTEQRSVIHIWRAEEGSRKFTVTEGLEWAFCAPVPGESSRGWCLYVSGAGTRDGRALVDDQPLQGDLRFTELVAKFLGSVRQVRLLEEHKTQLSTFLSPNLIENVTGSRADHALKPAERDITVLFCDVHGFSLKAEQMSNDLLRLLRSVSEVLGVMVNGILQQDGVIADFQGDAALGFWGWPVELEAGPIPACRAALDICRAFRVGQENEDSLLYGFSVGIGVAHGRAIAGQIGTTKQAKVGVFGPIVNQGARLEGLTRHFDTPICIDEVTADRIREQVPSSDARTRRLARVRPKGMRDPLSVFALLPAAAEQPELSDEIIQAYDQALDATLEGRWEEARRQLRRLPRTDGPTRFLLDRMSASGNTAPDDWDGAFSLASK